MSNKNKYASRRATPWDKMERTPMREFIKANYDESWTQKDTVRANTNEAALINTILPAKCPRYQGEDFVKKGLTHNGVQRYLCRNSGRKFLPTTGTIFDEHKISIREWIDYCLNILRYVKRQILLSFTISVLYVRLKEIRMAQNREACPEIRCA